MKARLTERETNELVIRLEERKYGRRLNSMELAQKANVPLDQVNRVENQLPVEDPMAVERIARALGISAGLLSKIAGFEEMSNQELNQLHRCLSPAAGEMPAECEQPGLLQAQPSPRGADTPISLRNRR
jgi:transcriptional regulator with XRE-family HTH domain